MMLRIGSVTLTHKDLGTHVYGIGKSRSGKSKLIELICRQLISNHQGFCLIDPHGTLCRDLLSWLAFMRPNRDIYLFEPNNEERIVGFNPFLLPQKDEARIMTKAEKMLAATLRAWDITDSSKTPRLTKWLKRLYYTLIEQDLPVTAAEHFLDPLHEHQRAAIIANIKNASIKSYWQQLYGMKPASFTAYFESTENRLEIFRHRQVRRILGLPYNNLNLRHILDSQSVLLVNFQSSPVIADESNRVLGTLLINEIWQIAKEREKPRTFFLIVDECQLYATPDIGAMLDQSAKFGLHLMLFHQREGHLPKDLKNALLNAQTRFEFSTDDSPKKQRCFTVTKPDLSRTAEMVPTVGDFHLPPARITAYKESLLARFLPCEKVDDLLDKEFVEPPRYEMSDEELYR
jgi:DNA helicase HerA-like ATPase